VGSMMRRRVRRMEKANLGDTITVALEDGSVRRFSEADQVAAFKSMSARLRALHKGEPISPPLSMEEATKNAVGTSGPIALFVDVESTARAAAPQKRD
jgi:hypothetical protein